MLLLYASTRPTKSPSGRDASASRRAGAGCSHVIPAALDGGPRWRRCCGRGAAIVFSSYHCREKRIVFTRLPPQLRDGNVEVVLVVLEDVISVLDRVPAYDEVLAEQAAVSDGPE